MKEFGSKGEVRLRFRLRTVSAELLGDKERCGMRKDGKCELCDEGVAEDIVHFLLYCGKFVGDIGRLLGMIEGIDGTEEWMAEWRNIGDEGRVGVLLGRSVAGVKEVLVRIDRVAMGDVLKWWERKKYLMFGT